MAKTEKSRVESILDDYRNDLGAMELTYASFDEKEKILMSTPIDQITKKETRSKVTDPTLLSAVLKQNNSVMAQMPSGKVTALTQENRGKSLFMDVILREHILPHATSQFDAYTKLWMLSLYRKMYGSFGVLVDFVQNKGYIGPDFTLLPARSIVPQSGKTTVEDSDRIWVRSRVSKKWLESLPKGVWKNVDKVLETEGGAPSDVNSQSYVERQNSGMQKAKNEYELVSCYEGDRWRTFYPDLNLEMREIDNPQKNDQIPVIMCHAYPLLDRFFGLGDFERGATLHASAGSLINLYMDGVKMSIFPPFKIDPLHIDNWEDFKDGIGPGQIWLMKRGFFDAIQRMEVSPAGIESFQSTYGFLKAAILTLTNTSDTGVSQATDPGFGKTPQALKMQAFTQGMQTQFDRRMLEIATEKIFDRMIDLLAKRQEKPMPLYLKGRDLERVAEVAPDVVEMFEVGNMGKVVIKPQQISNCDYRYEIDQGSTVKKDDVMENEALKEVTGFILKTIPNAVSALSGDGLVPIGSKKFDLGEAIKRITISSGVTDWDKIVVENEQNETEENALNTEDPKTMESFSQAFNPQQQPQPQPGQTPVVEAPQAPTPAPQGQATEPGFEDPAIADVFSHLTGIHQGGGANDR